MSDKEKVPAPKTHHVEIVLGLLGSPIECEKMARKVEDAYTRISARAISEDQVIMSTIEWCGIADLAGAPALVIKITAQRADRREIQEAQMRAALGQRPVGGMQ